VQPVEIAFEIGPLQRFEDSVDLRVHSERPFQYFDLVALRDACKDCNLFLDIFQIKNRRASQCGLILQHPVEHDMPGCLPLQLGRRHAEHGRDGPWPELVHLCARQAIPAGYPPHLGIELGPDNVGQGASIGENHGLRQAHKILAGQYDFEHETIAAGERLVHGGRQGDYVPVGHMHRAKYMARRDARL
jgi:hypothetical protein